MRRIDVTAALRAGLERLAAGRGPGPFVPYVRDVRIVPPETGRVLIDGHVDLNALAEPLSGYVTLHWPLELRGLRVPVAEAFRFFGSKPELFSILLGPNREAEK